MPPKRHTDNNASEELSGRERKKQKTAQARSIAVQSAPSNANENATAGPSKSVRFDSMKGLPGALDVERFAESRAFEIKAMQEAMQNARSNATQRAWQQLPRHLRRRAASHDVRRVPLRLRDKARAEMDPARRKASGRSMPKKSKKNQPNRTAQLLRRQKDKSWLETHIWHAKRMHMENMWGYRLAVTPTEKSFRPSHRASVHGSILHDASYYATIEIKGPEDILRTILNSCCDCQGPSPGAKRFLTGARTLETYLYHYNSYPHRLIAPVTVQWQAETTQSKPNDNSSTGKSTGKGKGKEKAAPNDPHPAVRVVWLRVHPAVLAEAHQSLRLAASFALDAAKQAGRAAEVEMADLREQFNMFEIMGPKASQVLKGALKPVDDQRADFKKFWASLSQLQSAGSVPRGMVVGFTVQDPRLSFPPKNAKVDVAGGATLSPASTVFPSAALAESKIWDEETRMALRKPRYKKKDIDQRRSNNLVPGTPLKADHKDDRIPVLLIQRSVETTVPTQPTSTAIPRALTTNSLHGWTLIIPQGWGMPFLSSLIYTGTRVGGQRERQTQAFEAGCAYFPRDFPSTDAYEEYAEDKAIEDEETWGRKPPAKRPNYEKLGTRSPWKADWGVVLGLERPAVSQEAVTVEGGEDLLDSQRDVEMTDAPESANPPLTATATAEPAQRDVATEPWLLRGPDVPSIVADISSMLSPSNGLLLHLNQARAKRKLDPLSASVRVEDLMRTALVQVGISLCGRGKPEDLAVIYHIDDEEARRWITAEARKQSGLALLDEGPDETELSQVSPSPEGIIGYVTTGSFSLSLGEGHAVGAIPLKQYLDLQKQAQRLRNEGKLLVKVRNRDETICRTALIDLLY
ncbi:POP1-domain-containing protein [Trametes sanguinea]|nr:POP1-domain-containing protein [Trametes sanguinea]